MAGRTGRRVTLGDIARETGYTINTVSHALRDKEDISLETRIRIQETADRMGYVRNVMASGLRSGRTRTLGVILGELENPYYAILASELTNAAEKRGYTLMILSSRDLPEKELQMANTAIGHLADGILIFPSPDPRAALARMDEAGIPYVLLARKLENRKIDCVIGDDAQGLRLAAQHLIEHGKRHLGYYSLGLVQYSTAARLKGFLQACEEAGIPETDRRIAIDDPRPMGDVLEQWIREGIDGLCVFCDAEAWQIINQLSLRGYSVPKDLAVVGFDNLQDYLGFPGLICSVGFDMSLFARDAIDLIRHKIHHPERPPEEIVCPCFLSCRHSCGPAD